MTKPQNIIIIQGSDAEGHWYEAICQDPATALYYLAQKAARCNEDLHHDNMAGFYQIGPFDYDLITYDVLDLAAVNKLRKEHEQCFGSALKPITTPSESNRLLRKKARPI